MTETINASFLERLFDEYADAVEAALVEAGHAAHERSSDAKAGSRLKTDHAYGNTFWLALPQEVCSRLLKVLEGATLFTPAGAQYDLVVWNGIAILPVKPVEVGKRDGLMRARISPMRSRLTRVNRAPAPPPSLFDDVDGFSSEDLEESSREAAEAARAELGDVAHTMVVAAFACDSKTGLRVVRVGIATFDSEGHINFSKADSEKLSLTKPAHTPAQTPAQTPAKPVAVAGESFDAARRPNPFLQHREEEQVATGETAPTGQSNGQSNGQSDPSGGSAAGNNRPETPGSSGDSDAPAPA